MTNPGDAPMPDDEPMLLVHAYLDGELDPANALSLERRIEADAALAAERMRTETLRRALRERVPAKPLPPQLRRRVEAAVGLARTRARPASAPSWRALAASVALAVVASSGATFLATDWFASRDVAGDRIAAAVVDDHLRALMAPQPIDVRSTDRHTVKPWFNGRTAQAPRVVDLAAEGFPLVGGRIDVIANAPVPTLVYQHRQHLISVSAVPEASATTSGEAHRAIRGYNLVQWRDNGVAYWAISDLGGGDLDAFVHAFRTAPAD
jgi:anti-sigma factor RsiW